MSSPFDHAEDSYLVLRNDEDQYSLWPALVDVPARWHVALSVTTRQDCLTFIEQNWVDMRPRSLRRTMPPEP